MKSNTWFIVVIIIALLMMLLFACRSAAPQPTPVPASDTPSPSPSLTMTQSKTPRPTRTLKPTSTPKPTENRPQPVDLLADFFAEPSPTFDAELAVTKTPSAPQQCPAGNPELVFDPELIFPSYDEFRSEDSGLNMREKQKYLLDYLNNGGDVEPVLQMCQKYESNGSTYCGDLTGDGLPEIMLRIDDFAFQGDYYIFGCLDGAYEEIYTAEEFSVFREILRVVDMNLDGIPEVVLKMVPDHGFSYWANYEILSWNARTMISQVSQSGFEQIHLNADVYPDGISVSGLGEGYDATVDQWQIKDIDHNGTLEFIVQGGLETHYYYDLFEPSLPYILTMMWNGEGFVVQDVEIGVPQYRFQAVQNGDAYTLLHQYDQARQSYMAAVNDPSLEWWTAEKSEQVVIINGYHDEDFITPTPSPEDTDERPNLAAYAQYRLILLDVLEGDLERAEQDYAAMQEAYTAGQAGSVYVDFAGVFLEEYQQSRDVTQACQVALDDGADHKKELLRYFGKEQAFVSRLVYELEDLCPFE
ncbi:MAG: hypothetical protein JEZ00_20265 [Anaerolineaceae bacterium]|nr:hypothetical protein [Anaerolineaceae bacterium]